MTAARLLIVTAVEAEAAAVRAGINPAETPTTAAGTDPVTVDATTAGGDPAAVDATTAGGDPAAVDATTAGGDPAAVDVAAVGVGPAAAAAGTARLLALAEARGLPYRAVISAGIAGGFAGRAEVGAVVLAARSIAADLGAETPDGFLPVEELGFGSSVAEADADLLAALSSALPHAVIGDVLTLATVTGTAGTAAALSARFPAAVAEAMEGHGVACAARAAGVPFAELRTISNPIGPRDRASWRLKEAFSALTDAAAKACG
ncbi:futalosine hydrolase [Couchioplanes caeruleus]|uniref:Futalosine hydrolase n=2 Tax=Couchioplanes caeruleus TaxID=56438 RepID=A0A1K0GTV8_9ACTN|nr:futalosine hydrolase [Couchioplanes caeruleus]OJF12747.1 futalosine hydrolase [Couchioplanes caeruleus subsp. caeruleus]ROP30639.1 futalosine hydrolase [Couchioplanes caeruleus]